ncbi:hypothetical protein BH24DEI1_BH24DEI1_02670 [soil metagenome]|jgi:mono/diheme cytochrome c family protein
MLSRLSRRLGLTLVLLAALAACRADRETQAESFAAAREAQPAGHALFLRHCAGCHGVAAGGGVGPRLLANPRLGDGDYVLGVIAGGRRAMPAFGNVLTEEEIAATTRFVQALEAAGGPE